MIVEEKQKSSNRNSSINADESPHASIKLDDESLLHDKFMKMKASPSKRNRYIDHNTDVTLKAHRLMKM